MEAPLFDTALHKFKVSITKEEKEVLKPATRDDVSRAFERIQARYAWAEDWAIRDRINEMDDIKDEMGQLESIIDEFLGGSEFVAYIWVSLQKYDPLLL